MKLSAESFVVTAVGISDISYYNTQMSHVVILEKVEFKDRLNMYVHPDEFMKLFMPVALWSMLRVQVDLEPPNGTYPISNLRG